MATDALKSYPIKGGETGRNRLSVLARVLAPTTELLFERAGGLAGLRVIDAGCGGGDVTFALARHVGPAGHVIGIDLDEEKLALARAEAKARDITHVHFAACNVTARWPVSNVGLVYARFILTHLSDPLVLLEQARAALKPGGTILVEDIDIPGCFCYPDCPAFDRFHDLYGKLSRQRGGDPAIGRRLAPLLEQAGFQGVGTMVFQPFAQSGDVKQIPSLTLAAVKDGLVASGLASPEEIADLHREIDEFTQRPDTIMSMPRIFQPWGAKK